MCNIILTKYRSGFSNENLHESLMQIENCESDDFSENVDVL